MRPISFEVNARSTVELPEVSQAFSEMNSDDQSVMLMDMFDGLEHRCKDYHTYMKQVDWIATSIKRYNFKNLKNTIEKLNEFLKDET